MSRQYEEYMYPYKKASRELHAEEAGDIIEVDDDPEVVLCGDCWQYTDSYRKDKQSETGFVCQHAYECGYFGTTRPTR